RYRPSRKAIIASFALSLITISAVPIASAQEPAAQIQSQSVDIPAQSLQGTLLDLADVFGVNVVAPRQLVLGKRAPAVKGQMSVTEALEQALSGSGLTAQTADNGSFVIIEQPVTATPISAVEPIEAPTSDEPRIEQTIIVTGEKVERSLQDTISSVSVLTSEALESSVILDLDQAVQRIPNVTIVPDGFGLSIRGIAQQGIGNGTFDPVAATSAVYIDGAVQTQEAVANGVLSTWDVRQVEVFRGPQTATQGRSGLAGALILNANDPEFEWGGQARLIANDQNRQQASIAFGGPLIDDVLAFRIAAETVDDDGYTEFSLGGITDDTVGRNNRDFIRGKLLFTPVSNLEALLSLTYVEGERGSNGVSGPDFFARNSTQIVNVRNSEVLTGSLVVDYDFNDAVSVQWVTAFSDLDVVESVDPDTAAGTGLAVPAIAEDETFSQEVRLTYDAGGAVRAIVGVYYADINEDFERTITGQQGPFTIFRNDGFVKSFENTAIFGQVEFDVTERLSITAGGRFESEERTFSDFGITDIEPDFPAFPDSSTAFEGTGDDTAFLPKLSATYDVSDTASISATFQQAYRPGGTGLDPRDNSQNQFDPETSNNYDIAFRSTWLDERLVLNANAFLVDYTDMQIRVSPDPAFPLLRFVDNAGEAELYGLEIESLFNPNSEWSFYASAALQESEFQTFSVAGVDAAGDEFAFAPG
ncbi:MAG: TonB-dependent receptor, partial [Pseudomonadota bacterium]